jgi:hypothetical protein
MPLSNQTKAVGTELVRAYRAFWSRRGERERERERKTERKAQVV